MSTRTPPDLQLRPLREDDLPAAWAMTQALQWPHRQEDWLDYLHQAQAHGNPLALCRGDALLGTALAWHWGAHQASIGMVIVAPEWQGRGIGRHLFETLLHSLDDRDVLLHATPEGMPLYASLGFRPAGLCEQFQGIWHPAGQPSPATTTTAAGITPAAAGGDDATGLRVRALRADDIDALVRLDEQHRGIARDWLLRPLLGTALSDDTVLRPDETPAPPPQVRAAVIEDADGQRRGFGLLRRFGRGWVLGPLLAGNETRLLSLLRWLTRGMDGHFIRIDLPQRLAAFADPADSADSADSAGSAGSASSASSASSTSTASSVSAALPASHGSPTTRHSLPSGNAEMMLQSPAPSLLHAWLQAQGLGKVAQTMAMTRLAGSATRQLQQGRTPAVYALLTQAQG